MSKTGDVELYEQAVSLLRPGEDTLEGIVVHTELAQHEEQAMNKLMREVGETVAEHLTDGEVYIYAGDDDERFGAGQFHGRRLADDAVVWECQQLLREGTFDLVFYWEQSGEQGAIVDSLEDLENEVVAITEDGYIARQ